MRAVWRATRSMAAPVSAFVVVPLRALCAPRPRAARARFVCTLRPRDRGAGDHGHRDDDDNGGGSGLDDDALRAQLEKAVVARDFERAAQLSHALRRRQRRKLRNSGDVDGDHAEDDDDDGDDDDDDDDDDANERRVLRANARFYDALRNGDVQAMQRLWMRSDAVCCALPMRPLAVGVDAVCALWTRVLAAPPAQVTLREVRVVARRNVAWVVCEQSVSTRASLSEMGGVRVATNVFQRRRGQWLLVHHHASPLLAGE
eukprot:TRINITY_DN814_c0_g1_i1.p1 TRINITY_DN814_c0_g1~~TRINITY_DN814_c0_g1_i1.p1  ORF type:complete len:259 (-),score=81.14 TRINITY_DN814_c0_g1_i1:461-1237(-)